MRKSSLMPSLMLIETQLEVLWYRHQSFQMCHLLSGLKHVLAGIDNYALDC